MGSGEGEGEGDGDGEGEGDGDGDGDGDGETASLEGAEIEESDAPRTSDGVGDMSDIETPVSCA